MMDEHEPEGRLPREWLPEPSPPDEATDWDVLARSIVAAAGPALERPDEEAEVGWQVMLGSWLRPAVALAAAAAVVAFAADRVRPAEPGRPALPLAVLAADGDAAALWKSIGVEADPVLGLVALDGALR